MLRRLELRDFAIVRDLALDFGPGYTVLTGETGAGKSILIDALQFVLGARADATAVREGAVRAEVCAEFDCPDALRDWLREAGFDDAEATLLLRRTVDVQGRGRGWINGSAATAAQLRELGESLVDIHGQHAWQSLTRPTAVRALLDAYGGVDSAAMARAWHEWRAAQDAVTAAAAERERAEQDRRQLDWQIAEAEKIAPQEGEWGEINTAQQRLANAQALIDAAREALAALDGDDGPSVRDSLRAAIQALRNQQHVEPDFQGLAASLTQHLTQIGDTARDLRLYLDRAEPDPARLAELDARISRWLSLARRLRLSPEALPAALDQWRADRARLEDAGDPERLAAREWAAREAWQQLARAASQQRAAAADRLAQAVTDAMQQLGMAGGRFEVQLVPLEAPAAHGLEDVVFCVAAHAGATPRPVSRVASGGELSRLALAIAVTTSRLGGAATLIFDEIDAGVGGTVALAVGRLMRQLGHDRQVLAVTHLPQVAARADHHLRVTKHGDDQGTHSRVRVLDPGERADEIARMLGSDGRSATPLAHARELLEAADGA